MTTNAAKTGVLLVNLGTPEEPTPRGVKRYLQTFLSDTRVIDYPRLLWLPLLYGVILPLRSRRVAKLYQSIWLEQGSPLRVYSLSLAEKVQSRLGAGFYVRCAMTYGSPSIESELANFKQRGYEHLVVVPMYPQYSCTTTASVFDAIAALLKRERNIPQISFVKSYVEQPAYIQALAGSVEKHWQAHGRGDQLLFSFHGIPERYVKQGDPYQQHCLRTAELVVKVLGLSEAEFKISFQSRVGKEQWLQPYTDKTIAQLAKSGTKTLDVICPAFSVDCLETLEEISEEGAEIFTEAGGEQLRYIPALNDDDTHAELFAQLARDYAPVQPISVLG